MRYIEADYVDDLLNWPLAISILRKGHAGDRPLLKDMLFESTPGRLLGRAVHLPGIGVGMKVASIHPPNLVTVPTLPAEDALFIVIGEKDWRIKALVAGVPITKWKTAADSALASILLSREDSQHLLCIGSGPIAEVLIEAHVCARPSINRVSVWNRTTVNATALRDRLAEKGIEAQIAIDIDEAVSEADIISSATSSPDPIIKGAYVTPGTHVDLVGGYSQTTRESDDALIQNASIYVDNRDTTLNHVGDIATPIESGVIISEDIRADLFELVGATNWRTSENEITLFKNGGGAHLDLMIADYIVEQFCSKESACS